MYAYRMTPRQRRAYAWHIALVIVCTAILVTAFWPLLSATWHAVMPGAGPYSPYSYPVSTVTHGKS